MSILSEQEKLLLIEKAKEYDYIRFSWPDLNGIPRGKTVPGRNARSVIRNGIYEYTGTLCLGPRAEMPHIQSIHDNGYGNSSFVPATKLFDLPWAGHEGQYKVGQVICETFWPDGSPVSANPRTVAQRQLARLDSMGYKLYSAFEVEFFVVDAKTLEPVFDGNDFGIDLVLSEQSKWVYALDKALYKLNIDTVGIHPEFHPGQFEFSMVPKYGIETFDDIYVMKQAIKEILPQYGVKPTFMTNPYGTEGSSGFHFNHSLWDSQDQNVFYDASKPHKMSDAYRYWVGGLMKHLLPLLALCNSTPNCYRRLHAPWAPDKADWDIDNRFVSIRVKNTNADNCYVENRLPSSASNPYIVAAATIAAGLDGIENKIEPPERGQRDSIPALPSFEECIKALQEDTVLVDALGKEFVNWWVAMKTECELHKFSDLTMKDPSEEEMAKERKEYFDHI